MPTIAFVSSKGGVGKTTAALLLAQGLVERGIPVALVDSDPNLPLTHWASLPGKPAEITVVQSPSFADLPGAVRTGKRAAEWVVIDTEGGAPRMGGWAIEQADMVIVPLAASILELREALKLGEQVAAIEQRSRRAIRLVCALTRIPSGRRTKTLDELRRRLEEEGVPVLPTIVAEKEAFRALFSRGGMIGAMDRRLIAGNPNAPAIVAAFAGDVVERAGPA